MKQLRYVTAILATDSFSAAAACALGCETDVVLMTSDACVDELRAGRFRALITLGPIAAEGAGSYCAFMEERGGVSLALGGEFLAPFDNCVIRPIAARDRMPVPICLSSLTGAGVSYLELSRALAKMKILF